MMEEEVLLEFEWGPRKAAKNLRKHKVSFPRGSDGVQ